MTTNLSALSNDELDREARRVATVERQTTAELLRLLIEVERRDLHLALGYSSMFGYCTRALHLSEQAAYSRITAARAARRFPRLFDLLVEGSVTLSGVGLLGPCLSDETADALLDASRFKTTREVQRMLATAFPQPDIAPSVRALPPTVPAPASSSGRGLSDSNEPISPTSPIAPSNAAPVAAPSRRASSRPVIAPIAPSRYLLRVTLSEDTEHKLQRARSLMRHSVPDGDLDLILNRALTLLLDRVARTRLGQARAPRSTSEPVSGKGRYIPAAIRREVWNRDGGKCVFAGADGACGETGFLEFHHVVPFGVGGPTTVANLELRCRAHNAHEAALRFGVNVADSTRRAPS